jgi:hypothetical protein
MKTKNSEIKEQIVTKRYLSARDPKSGVHISALDLGKGRAFLVFASTARGEAVYNALAHPYAEIRTSRGRVRWTAEGVHITAGRKTTLYPRGKTILKKLLAEIEFKDRVYQRNIMSLVSGSIEAEKMVREETGTKVGAGGITSFFGDITHLVRVTVCTTTSAINCTTTCIDEFGQCMNQADANARSCNAGCDRKNWWEKPFCFLGCLTNGFIETAACLLKGVVCSSVCVTTSVVTCEVKELQKLGKLLLEQFDA